eukprot:1200456-Rhodomonas_salina.2
MAKGWAERKRARGEVEDVTQSQNCTWIGGCGCASARTCCLLALLALLALLLVNEQRLALQARKVDLRAAVDGEAHHLPVACARCQKRARDREGRARKHE